MFSLIMNRLYEKKLREIVCEKKMMTLSWYLLSLIIQSNTSILSKYDAQNLNSWSLWEMIKYIVKYSWVRAFKTFDIQVF